LKSTVGHPRRSGANLTTKSVGTTKGSGIGEGLDREYWDREPALPKVEARSKN
jgi:hypothetical protein